MWAITDVAARPQAVQAGAGQGEEEMIAASPRLRNVLDLADMVAGTDCTVLIQGDTGTGKELVAGFIHSRSPRGAHILVKVNCAAIPLGLLESELFGHERGAFTGALAQRMGRFELADKGSLFLDEVGDIPLELQPKLLRVLQEREFERLGSTRTIQTNVRLIAATHCNLAQMVEEGRFRRDLYYRLNVFPICVPPLRDRPEDIPLLVRHFTHKYALQMKRRIETIPTAAMESMVNYSWPGNIRELQNFIERAVILTRGTVLEPPVNELIRSSREAPDQPITLREADRAHILRTLEKTKGQVARAAALLAIPRSTLFYRIRRLGIVLPKPNSRKATA